MKRICFILALFIVCTAHAQTLDSNNVPVAVRHKLHVMYPYLVSVEWVHDNATLDGKVNGIETRRELSFKAFANDGKKTYITYIDSSGQWYEDRGEVTKPEAAIVPPTSAFNKVVDVMPAHKELSWEYNDEPYYHAAYEAVAFKNDSDEDVEYQCYFDSLWQYTGWSITLTEDTSIIPVHAVNSYIKEHYKHADFSEATIDMDKDGAIKQIEVTLELKHKHYNMRILDFDGKGKLTGPPQKGIACHYIGVTF